MEPQFFEAPAHWRAWLEKHHDDASEVLVGFYKKGSGQPSIDWPESVDEALCFGWIDGVRRRIDEVSYSIRFTPRKAKSVWSAVNVGRVAELTRAGLMHPAGLAAFERGKSNLAQYSYEGGDFVLSPDQLARLQADGQAWEFFQRQPASYRKAAISWVVKAKGAETAQRRLQALIDDSGAQRRLARFTSPTGR
jgi:uncharacterized protein YdeI (YjbR/CyaY-like superfamily)